MWLIDMGASPSLESGSPCSAVGFVKKSATPHGYSADFMFVSATA